MKSFILLTILFTSALSSKNDNRPKFILIGFYEEKGKIHHCESGYNCPGDGNRYECPDCYYSTDQQKECAKCGCVNSENCLKGTTRDDETGIRKYAGQCEGDAPCKPGYGYNPKISA